MKNTYVRTEIELGRFMPTHFNNKAEIRPDYRRTVTARLAPHICADLDIRDVLSIQTNFVTNLRVKEEFDQVINKDITTLSDHLDGTAIQGEGTEWSVLGELSQFGERYQFSSAFAVRTSQATSLSFKVKRQPLFLR